MDHSKVVSCRLENQFISLQLILPVFSKIVYESQLGEKCKNWVKTHGQGLA